MKSEDLLEAIGEVREEHIADARAGGRTSPRWVRWAAGAAACLLLAAGGAALLNRPGVPEAEAPAAGQGHGGHDEGMTFMHYAGPVFPLSLMEEAEDITAERRLTLNFAAYTGENTNEDGQEGGITAADEYLLANGGAEMTVTAVYPIAGNFQLSRWPVIRVDGEVVDYEIVPGGYSGGFRGAGDERTTSLNLDYLTSWEGYRELLTDGSYYDEAFAPAPELATPVTVYKFTDITDGGCGYDAATLGVHYSYDPENTNIMTFGFNGGGEEPEAGEGLRCFFIREALRRPDEETKYLVVVGRDIWDVHTKGYQNGSCQPEVETEGPAAGMARRECTLGEILEEIAMVQYEAISGSGYDGDANRYLHERISFEMYYGDMCKYFAEHGPTGAQPKERYTFEWGARMDDIVGETPARDRILYLTFPVTVPAGGSAAIAVEQHKGESFDFTCGGHNTGIEGYDLVTALGSSLAFTGQRAAIANYEHIEIVRQNLGFDLEQGIADVELDMACPHYYLEVREREAAE